MKPDQNIVINNHPKVYDSSEDSYLLLWHIDVKKGEKVLEIGTGCGLIALHCAKIADVTATDINPHALTLANENAHHNDLKLRTVRSNLFEDVSGKYDVIIFNPPYLERDRPIEGGEGKEWIDKSWEGGVGGEEVILRFLFQARDFLGPTGRIYLLISSNNKRALSEISKMYRSKILGERRLFFEVLKVYELSL